MDNNELMRRELLTISRLNKKLDLNNPKSIGDVKKEMENNDSFKTAIGLKFKKRVEDIYSGQANSGLCVVCGKNCERNSALLCNVCEQAIEVMRKTAGTLDSQDEKEQDGIRMKHETRSGNKLTDQDSYKEEKIEYQNHYNHFKNENGQWNQDSNWLIQQANNQMLTYLCNTLSIIQKSVSTIEGIIVFWNIMVIIAIVLAIGFFFFSGIMF